MTKTGIWHETALKPLIWLGFSSFGRFAAVSDWAEIAPVWERIRSFFPGGKIGFCGCSGAGLSCLILLVINPHTRVLDRQNSGCLTAFVMGWIDRLQLGRDFACLRINHLFASAKMHVFNTQKAVFGARGTAQAVVVCILEKLDVALCGEHIQASTNGIFAAKSGAIFKRLTKLVHRVDTTSAGFCIDDFKDDIALATALRIQLLAIVSIDQTIRAVFHLLPRTINFIDHLGSQARAVSQLKNKLAIGLVFIWLEHDQPGGVITSQAACPGERLKRAMGMSPTVQELAVELGVKAPSVFEGLKWLEDKGYIRRQARKARSIEILHAQTPDKTNLTAVPVLGIVAAGQPILALENRIGQVMVPDNVLRGKCFALKVQGDSMIDADIFEGDYVVVRQQPIAENSDIVVAMVDIDLTVKRLSVEGEHIELRPENQKLKPIIIGQQDELKIIGKILHVCSGVDTEALLEEPQGG